MNSPWFQRFVPRPGARLRLFCFAHAGGSAAVYRPWCNALPDAVELIAIQLPGRANRLNDPVVTRLDAIVEAVVAALRPHLDRPYALFGHSMGAVLANEVARALRHEGAPQPGHLFVSGRRPPHWPNPDPLLHVLSDADFVAEIQRRYGGIPPEVAEHEELMAMLLPSLRADIHALETHAPPAGRPPLACPLSVFGGSHDPLTPREHLEGWRSESSGPFRLRVLPGDHFYLNAQRDALLAEVSASLAPLLGRVVA
ncbi:thioesterase II family protein [Hydrogenophaga borbori]|uniref:thioesterase II family protein n=1 Tax=Hydrogenophaga borbori TaxID=2294117 RepID=UPI00301CFE39